MRQVAIVLMAMIVLGGTFVAVRHRAVDQVPRVPEGVTLGGKDVGNFTVPELTTYLETLAGKLYEEPIQPKMDPRTKGVIPGLAGRQLNIDATVAFCLAAEKEQDLHYTFEPVLPEVPPLDKPIFQGNNLKRQISFVVNVAWGNSELIEILDIFDQHELKMTFFLVGRWATKFPELVREIHKRGHEFGNHAYSDPHLPRLSDDKIKEEITRTTESIRKAVGDVAVPYFSPPYNDYDDRVVRIAAMLGYTTVLCSLDTADWMRPGVDRIVRRITLQAHNGAIVLMHPTEQTPAALRQMIPRLQAEGYELVPISALLSPHR